MFLNGGALANSKMLSAIFEFHGKAKDYVIVLPIVISCIAITLTLIQLSLLRRQLHLDALIKIVQSNRELMTMGFEKPALWEFFKGKWETVTDEAAKEQRRRYFQLWLNHMHVIWKAREVGLYDMHEWNCTRDDMADFFRLEPFRAHWHEVQRFYPEPFRREMRELIAFPPKQPE